MTAPGSKKPASRKPAGKKKKKAPTKAEVDGGASCDCCADQPAGVMVCEDGVVNVFSPPTSGGPWGFTYNPATGDYGWQNLGGSHIP